MNGAREEYFEWLASLAGGMAGREKIFRLLHATPFEAVLPRDENRAGDGEDLRYRFAWETGMSVPEADECFRDGPCSVLEMMVALAVRCEEHITDDPDSGDRTAEWFDEMLWSLGLSGMDDAHFDETEAKRILDIFMRREYEPNGRGGLFTILGGQDMRTTEIWYQLMRYLNETLYSHRRW